MDNLTQLKNAIEFAKSNPDDLKSAQLRRRIELGMYNNELKQLKERSVEEAKKNRPLIEKIGAVGEKIAKFTGGEKIGQGLGQALANPQIAKQQEQALNDAINQQTALLKRRKEIMELGGDTSHIDKGLEYNRQSQEEISQGMEGILNQKGLTPKQIIGDALQLGTTIAGAGTYGKAATGMTSGVLGKSAPSVISGMTGAKTFGQGAIQGAKTGAISGGIYGASSGTSSALKQDKSLGEVATSGLKGGLYGAAIGGATGAIVGGIQGGIAGRKAKIIENKKESILDLVSPNQTEAYKVKALKEGRVSEQGLFTGAKIQASKRDIQLYDAVKDVVKPNLSPTKNIDLLNSKVSDINTGVKAFVEKNKVPFNYAQLKKQLNLGKEDLDLIFAGDKQAANTYNAVVNKFLKTIEKGDTKGLLDARQAFDNIPAIKKLLNSQGLGENAKKEIVDTVRENANRYISELLPAGNKYREAILNESKMLTVVRNLAEKNPGLVGTSKFQAFVSRFPIIKIGLGQVVSAGVGAGGVIAATKFSK